jgi:hypothetical protein
MPSVNKPVMTEMPSINVTAGCRRLIGEILSANANELLLRKAHDTWQMSVLILEEGNVNPLKTKRSLLYLKTHFVPRSKHFSSRL